MLRKFSTFFLYNPILCAFLLGLVLLMVGTYVPSVGVATRSIMKWPFMLADFLVEKTQTKDIHMMPFILVIGMVFLLDFLLRHLFIIPIFGKPTKL